MSKVVAVGGPKGGVGKTTLALNISTYASRILGLNTYHADSDKNISSYEAAMAAGDSMPFDVGIADNPDELAKLHDGMSYDLVVVDLPGAKESGALTALLTGSNGSPVVDAIVFPTAPDIMDLRPLMRAIPNEIVPLGLPYLIVLSRVHPARMEYAQTRQSELRAAGYQVADTIGRNLVAQVDAVEAQRAVMDLPGGKRSVVRASDREFRALAAESLNLLGFDTSALTREA